AGRPARPRLSAAHRERPDRRIGQVDMASLRLRELEKRFPDGTLAVKRVDLEVADGELLVLVGPSGCGKSTIMRMIAGLERPTAGRILIGDRDVSDVRPQERDVAMVFQSYALYPHKSVRDNLAFGLRMRGVPKREIAERIEQVAKMLELGPLLDKKPRKLSGGQRQRVALGRAIVRSPQVFLLDEPLSNLDARLRVQTRTELARLQRRLGATMVYVTHDQEEAMTLGDRVAVMRDGRIEQVGPPLEVYRRPSTAFVGGFVGSPAMSFLDATVEHGAVSAAGARLALPLAVEAGARLRLGIRPADVVLCAPGDGDARGRIDVLEALGHELLCHVRLEGGGALVRALAPADADLREGNEVGLRFPPERVHLFDAESGRRLA